MFIHCLMLIKRYFCACLSRELNNVNIYFATNQNTKKKLFYQPRQLQNNNITNELCLSSYIKTNSVPMELTASSSSDEMKQKLPFVVIVYTYTTFKSRQNNILLHFIMALTFIVGITNAPNRSSSRDFHSKFIYKLFN